MLIVLEGVDGAGKTTLTERLMAQMPEALRMHSGPLKGDPMKEYEWRLRDYRPDSSQTIITDRWHVGELIYGPLYRGSSKLSRAGARHVEMYLDKLGAHKLLVTSDIGTIMHRLQTRGEDFLQSNHVGMVWDFYNEYAVREGWTRIGSDEILNHITTEARRLRADARRLWKFTTYVGPTHPKHLIVTNEAGSSPTGRPRYHSTFVPYDDQPGAYLLEALEDVGLRDYGLISSTEAMSDAWHALGRPNVVSLDERVTRSIPFQIARSPQQARRDGDINKYGLEIKEMLRA